MASAPTTARPQLSSHNPFRSQNVTPNPTGASSSNPSLPSLTPNPTGSLNPFLAPAESQPSRLPPSLSWSSGLDHPNDPEHDPPTLYVQTGRSSGSSSSSSESSPERAERLPQLPSDARRVPHPESPPAGTGSAASNVTPASAPLPPPLPPRDSPISPRSAPSVVPPPLPPRGSSMYAPPSGPPPRSRPQPSPSTSTASLASYAPPPGPPPPHLSAAPTPVPGHLRQAQPARADSLGPPPGSPPPPLSDLPADHPPVLDPDELPPAYTSTADTRAGEATIDIGPRRPFQRAPPMPAVVTPQPTGTGPGRAPNHLERRAQHRAALGAASLGLPPPARPRSASDSRRSRTPDARGSPDVNASAGGGDRQPSSSTSSLQPPSHTRSVSDSRPLSDFAREFYAAGGRSGGAESDGPRYAPPSGPPPPGSVGRAATSAGAGTARTASSSSRGGLRGGASGGGGGGGGGVRAEVDAQPTTVATPGRPLLNMGQTLEYPAGYVCPKCKNTGYKGFDPDHPCRRCWKRYSKPYSQLLALAAWDTPDTRMQRPLPNFISPRPNAGVGAGSSRTISTARRAPEPSSPIERFGQRLEESIDRFAQTRPGAPRRVVSVARGTLPPAGAVTVRPGDPRLGGRLCWRCDGRGWHSFMLFDEVTCEECGGLGRTGVVR